MADPKNPARPDSSPIQVTHATEWDPYKYHSPNYTRQTNTGIQPVPKLVSVEEEQINKNTKVRKTRIVDQEIASALQKDLKNRNIK